ncbi:MAG: class I mannose-6-phosphate isomerase, partial [Myxococcales bacterium]|nr:class I mannose-6-phosphate isomerase [Myxococcales bacterium]
MTVRPLLLESGNFTPPSRTPWGGRRIGALKGEVGGGPVGESWEVSVEPDFPSRIEGGGLLGDHLAKEPTAYLGREAAAGRTSTALLVKLLDAAAPLSLQIHPTDDYPALGANESGKPESWYIVAHDEGAGLYLGFREGVSREAVEECLAKGRDLRPLLHFVPVEVGDFFAIEAGTPHAVGGGVFLVEPQHVLPGRRGVTYRYWDWGRRYDPSGREDPTGSPRDLHVDHALNVTRWDPPGGPSLLRMIHAGLGPANPLGPARSRVLAGPGGVASE